MGNAINSYAPSSRLKVKTWEQRQPKTENKPLKTVERPRDVFVSATKEKVAEVKTSAPQNKPKKKGFFGRLFGGLKKAFKLVMPFVPKLLNFIPVVGPMLSSVASTFIR